MIDQKLLVEQGAFSEIYFSSTGVRLDMTAGDDGELLDPLSSAAFHAFKLGQEKPQPLYVASEDTISVSEQEPSNWGNPGWRVLFLEALTALLKAPPTPKMVEDYLDDEDVDTLQQFCVEHQRVNWAMGISAIDAAYLYVEGAYENANIDKQGNLWPMQRMTLFGSY